MSRALLPLIRCSLLAIALAQPASAEPGQRTAPSNLSNAGLACPGFLVAIDVGHSKLRPGAISSRGKPEFYFNREIALQLSQALDALRIETVLINMAGDEIRLTDRSGIANAAGASLFISVHHDSVQPIYLRQWLFEGRQLHYSNAFRGFSFFVSERHYPTSRNIAALIARRLIDEGLQPTLHHAEDIEGERRKLVDRDLGIYENNELAVLRTSNAPAILFEVGVIVNPVEESFLSDPSNQLRIARAVAETLAEHCRRLIP